MTTPAGWYPATDRPGNERYWDGQAWTEHMRPVAPPGEAPVPPPQAWAANPNMLPQAKKKHTVRNVLLIIAALLILSVGGCVALIGGAAKSVDNAIKKDANKPGGTNHPLTIIPGRAFEVDRFNYAAGWRLGKDALGDIAITGLKVTNNRANRTAPSSRSSCGRARRCSAWPTAPLNPSWWGRRSL